MRGQCQFDNCPCSKYVKPENLDETTSTTLCRNCNHGKVWHKNLLSVNTQNSLSMSPPQSPIPSAPKMSPINQIDMSCIVCNELRRSVLALPCKHFIVCETCFKSLPNKKCIMCRQEITDSIHNIFV